MLESLRNNISWRAIGLAGIGGGTAFLLTNLVLTPLMLEVDASLILRYFASLVLGDGVLVEWSNTTLIIGVIVHYVLSMLFAMLIAFVIHRWGLLVGIIGGTIMGLALYGINIYTMTVFFPWFFAINNSVLLISHIVFGAVTGGIYEMFDTYDLPLVANEEAAA